MQKWYKSSRTYGCAAELRLAARKFITPNTLGEEINPLEI
jgi:hypothetical protein